MTIKNNDHHLSLGETTDFLTGETIADSHDERYRQKIAKLLVHECGFDRSMIDKATPLIIHVGGRKSSIKVDFLVRVGGRISMVIKYNPGSIVTRRQTCLALSRIIAPYQIPVAVMTNGEDAEIIDGNTGEVTANGLARMPGSESLDAIASAHPFEPLPDKTVELASRIVQACEVDGACPCDTDVCVIED
ncbi:MAG: adenosine deaminase [Desulfobacteraceae bacterium]|nr:MAG: adenosine deaminase [Desulfobacteraceae bacterium]